MTTIRIVCTFDASGAAETLARLLAAEQYEVAISRGRQSLEHLPAAKNAQEAVILIWSKDAPSAQYMREWADAIEPARLVEIGRAPNWPHAPRRAPVIDFTNWRGERGGKAWHALKDRLRQVLMRWEPGKPAPLRAAAAIGMLSAAAVTSAFVVRINEAPEMVKTEPMPEQLAAMFAHDPPFDAVGGIGGGEYWIEPPSADEAGAFAPSRIRLRASDVAPLAERAPDPALAYQSAVLREPTIMERLIALNPLAREQD